MDLLEDFASSNRASALYCLYNFTQGVNKRDHWRCCTGSYQPHEFGCTITPSSTIRDVLIRGDKKSFGRIHCKDETLPWRRLVSCPMVESALEFMKSGASLAQQPDFSPLFDPTSCYYPTLPSIFSPNSGIEIVRENENGGVLMQLQVQEDGRVADPKSQITPAAQGALQETYMKGSGFPKAVAVLEVLPST